MAFKTGTVLIGESTKKSSYDQVLENTIYLKTSATQFTGEKTFQSGTVHIIKPKVDGIVTRSGTGSVSIECQYTSSAGNSVVNLKTKVIEIGDWNMSATIAVSIPHGQDGTKIRSVYVVIINDAETSNFDLYTGKTITDTTPQGFVDVIGNTHIGLRRLTGGIFDAITFNSTSFNRGWITIAYEA